VTAICLKPIHNQSIFHQAPLQSILEKLLFMSCAVPTIPFFELLYNSRAMATYWQNISPFAFTVSYIHDL
jgi:hypothetical protein